MTSHGQGSTDSLFYSICYAVSFLKSKKSNQCGDGAIQEVLGSNLCNLLYHKKDILQLSLGHQKFEKQYFRVNEILSKHGYFLRVFELRTKFYSPLTKNSEKQAMNRKISSCITEKLNGFNVVSLKYSRKLRKKIKPIDIIYKPTKNVRKKLTATFPGIYIEPIEAPMPRETKLNIRMFFNATTAIIFIQEKTNLSSILKIAAESPASYTILIIKILSVLRITLPTREIYL